MRPSSGCQLSALHSNGEWEVRGWRHQGRLRTKVPILRAYVESQSCGCVWIMGNWETKDCKIPQVRWLVSLAKSMSSGSIRDSVSKNKADWPVRPLHAPTHVQENTQANVYTPPLASKDATRTKKKEEEEEEDDNENSIKSDSPSHWRPRAIFLPYSSCPHQIWVQAPSSTTSISKLTTLKSMQPPTCRFIHLNLGLTSLLSRAHMDITTTAPAAPNFSSIKEHQRTWSPT